MADEIPHLTEGARQLLYKLVGYPQGEVPQPSLAAEIELALEGLYDPATGQETAKAHRVAEALLFS